MLRFIERLMSEVAHNQMKTRAINEYQLGEHWNDIDDESKELLIEEQTLRVRLNEVMTKRLEHVQEVYGDMTEFDD